MRPRLHIGIIIGGHYALQFNIPFPRKPENTFLSLKNILLLPCLSTRWKSQLTYWDHYIWKYTTLSNRIIPSVARWETNSPKRLISPTLLSCQVLIHRIKSGIAHTVWISLSHTHIHSHVANNICFNLHKCSCAVALLCIPILPHLVIPHSMTKTQWLKATILPCSWFCELRVLEELTWGFWQGISPIL